MPFLFSLALPAVSAASSCSLLPVSFFSIRRQKRVHRMHFKILGTLLPKLLAEKKLPVYHRTQQQRNPNFGIESAVQQASLLASPDKVGQHDPRRLDGPVAPRRAEGLVARSVAHQVRSNLLPHRLALRSRLMPKLGNQVGAKIPR